MWPQQPKWLPVHREIQHLPNYQPGDSSQGKVSKTFNTVWTYKHCRITVTRYQPKFHWKTIRILNERVWPRKKPLSFWTNLNFKLQESIFPQCICPDNLFLVNLALLIVEILYIMCLVCTRKSVKNVLKLKPIQNIAKPPWKIAHLPIHVLYTGIMWKVMHPPWKTAHQPKLQTPAKTSIFLQKSCLIHNFLKYHQMLFSLDKKLGW